MENLVVKFVLGWHGDWHGESWHGESWHGESWHGESYKLCGIVLSLAPAISLFEGVRKLCGRVHVQTFGGPSIRFSKVVDH